MKALIALQEFVYPYGRATVRRGQRFEALNDTDAHALTLAKLAREDDGTAEKGAITDAEARIRKAGKYKTRDMQAQ